MIECRDHLQEHGFFLGSLESRVWMHGCMDEWMFPVLTTVYGVLSHPTLYYLLSTALLFHFHFHHSTELGL